MQYNSDIFAANFLYENLFVFHIFPRAFKYRHEI